MADTYLGESVKKLGFGLMWLPRLGEDKFDIEQIKRMVDLFLADGYTYFDADGYTYFDTQTHIYTGTVPVFNLLAFTCNKIC